MKLLVCSLLVIACLSGVLSKTDKNWKEFKDTHKKSYKNAEREAARRKNWEGTFDIVEKHNAKAKAGEVHYTMAVNELSDFEQFEKDKLNGAVVPNDTRVTLTSEVPLPVLKALPASVDYRTNICMSPIKNQGSCGSCWAFSATSMVEYYNCRKNAQISTLYSEQHMISCDTSDGGCYGGFYTTAWQWVKNNAGQCTQRVYGYTSGTSAANGACLNSCTKSGKVSSFTRLVANSPSSIMNILATVGPVSTSMMVSNNFYNYQSGVFSDSICTQSTNHAVVIVGYGVTSTNIPYWIVRNSWGTSWGMSGYAFIQRGVQMCGIELYPAYPVVL